MRDRTASRLAWGLWAVNLTLLGAGGVMAVLGRHRPGDLALSILIPALTLTSATVGALIASRHPRNPIGWLFLGMGSVWGIAGLGTGVASLAAAGIIPVTGVVRVADWVGSWVYIPGVIIPVTFLFLLFPDGHLPSRRWRWVAGAAVAAVVVICAETALGPGPLADAVVLRGNPFAVGDRAAWDVVGSVAWITAIGCIVSSAVAMFGRFRRASGEVRQRIAWLAYGSIAVAVLFLTAAIGFFTTETLGR
ncbi:MAG TPA: hypothetical protein VJ868_02685, partial [Actinomycetota bacterium]|nr:hypothetical protein [Actinomycetota bacterium]